MSVDIIIRDGEKGEVVMELGGRGRLLYLSLHRHHQNDSCIKMGSDESHFNVSLIVRDKSHETMSTDQLLQRKESRNGFEPRSLRFPA